MKVRFSCISFTLYMNSTPVRNLALCCCKNSLTSVLMSIPAWAVNFACYNVVKGVSNFGDNVLTVVLEY